MTDFTITEDFPKSEIEFDQRFSNPDACYEYLFNKSGQMALSAKMRPQTVLVEFKKPVYLHPVRTPAFSDGWYDHGQFQKPDHLLVQSHVVVHHPQIRRQCGEPERIAGLWQLWHRLDLASKAPSLHYPPRNAKSFPAVSRSMSFSSAANVPANGVEGLKAKPSWPSPSNAETSRKANGSHSFACCLGLFRIFFGNLHPRQYRARCNYSHG
jgi:hypothetical protein